MDLYKLCLSDFFIYTRGEVATFKLAVDFQESL